MLICDIAYGRKMVQILPRGLTIGLSGRV